MRYSKKESALGGIPLGRFFFPYSSSTSYLNLGETRTVDVHIGQLRKKLGLQNAIKTVPKLGYRLEDGI